MLYRYCCNNCAPREIKTNSDYFVFEVEHGMGLNPKIECPACCGTNTERLLSPPMAVYIRGYGWLDKKGAHRDMNKFKLMTEDPYADMREPGEASDLRNRFRKQGLFNEGRYLKKTVKDDDTILIRATGTWDEEKQKVIWESSTES